MPEILWWVCGSIGMLLLLPVLWLVYRAQKFRRLQPIIFEYLSLQDMEAALRYIDNHPRLLTSDAEDFTTTLLDRAWARGDAELFVSGTIRLSLLAGCRERRYTRHPVALGPAQDAKAKTQAKVTLYRGSLLACQAPQPDWGRTGGDPGHFVVHSDGDCWAPLAARHDL